MTGPGDYDPGDVFDTEPADPEQTARKLYRLRRARGLDTGTFDDLPSLDRERLVEVAAALLAWLTRQGAFR